MLYFYNLEHIIDIIKDAHSYADICEKLNKIKSGHTYKIIKRIISENNIDISHFNFIKIIDLKINVWPFKNNGSKISSKLKYKLYKEGLKNRMCEICGQGEEWNGKKCL